MDVVCRGGSDDLGVLSRGSGSALGRPLRLALLGAALAAPGGRRAPSTAATASAGWARSIGARRPRVSPSQRPRLRDAVLVRPELDRHAPAPRTRRASYTIDFNTPDDLGKPALASAPGMVVKAVTLTGSYGRYVVVDHGGGYTTLYAHLNPIVATVGQVVDQGDLLGYVGGSGDVTGPHLHFEERRERRLLRAVLAPDHVLPSARPAPRPTATTGRWSGDWDGDGKADARHLPDHAAGTRSLYLRTAADHRAPTGARPATPRSSGDFDGDGICPGRRTPAGRSHLVAARQHRPRRSTVSRRRGLRHRRSPATGTATAAPTSGWYRWSTRTFYLRAGTASLTAVRWGTDRRPAGHRRLERRPAHRRRRLQARHRTWRCACPAASGYIDPARSSTGAAGDTSRSPATGTATAPPTSASGAPSARRRFLPAQRQPEHGALLLDVPRLRPTPRAEAPRRSSPRR